MAKPTYEVIVFGATSFVGQILCRYLVDQFGVGKSLRWAAAGRSIDKLKALKAEPFAEADKCPGKAVIIPIQFPTKPHASP